MWKIYGRVYHQIQKQLKIANKKLSTIRRYESHGTSGFNWIEPNVRILFDNKQNKAELNDFARWMSRKPNTKHNNVRYVQVDFKINCFENTPTNTCSRGLTLCGFCSRKKKSYASIKVHFSTLLPPLEGKLKMRRNFKEEEILKINIIHYWTCQLSKTHRIISILKCVSDRHDMRVLAFRQHFQSGWKGLNVYKS